MNLHFFDLIRDHLLTLPTLAKFALGMAMLATIPRADLTSISVVPGSQWIGSSIICKQQPETLKGEIYHVWHDVKRAGLYRMLSQVLCPLA